MIDIATARTMIELSSASYVLESDRMIAKAQAHATIALAEEQRTANLIAYLAMSSAADLDVNLMRDEIEHRLQTPSAPTTTSRASG